MNSTLKRTRQSRKTSDQSFLKGFSARLTKLIEARRIPIVQIAKAAGVNPQQIHVYKAGKQTPGADVLAKLCEVLEVDPAELLGISGPYVSVPLYPEVASGGHGRDVEPTDEPVRELHFRSDWLVKKKRLRAQLGAFSVTGSSMAPHVADRDVVLFDKNQRSGEGIFVVRIENALSVKRVEPKSGGDVELWGKDDKGNDKSYGLIPKSDIKSGGFEIIGRVFWRGGEV